ncbi:hypothetical protein FOQG_17821 [Fusarium oxysporum f. sp. raphani 54005]|uniref:Uncharacterized protein n=1 Tax=Fusarium oxysporum f. sp. raphani 54005 TaxID=1089458 RepID=X0BF48_FUSOX|nr:hypothetical protein FOQG_17821 [Fusarium oxysporum f. sp. raphani 54005]
MNGVDISDHCRSNTTEHRQRRGPARALAWSFLLTTAVANSFLLQKLGQPAWRAYKAQSQWQQRHVNDIFNTYGKTGSSRQRYRAGDEATPAEQHKHVNRKKQGRCLGCSDRNGLVWSGIQGNGALACLEHSLIMHVTGKTNNTIKDAKTFKNDVEKL